jgi:ADP-ribose pyrophosphatase YjhB (NUDIX family)
VGLLDGWRLCPRCGTEFDDGQEGLSCPSCGVTYYPHSVPAVAAVVTDDEGRVLLARRANEPDAGLWDTPGGFLEEAEDPVAGLRRELHEETGLEVEPGAFLGAFVDRYGGGSGATPVLNLVWDARVVSGEAAPADDVSELRWFAPDELPDADEYAFRWLAPFFREWAASRHVG